MMDDLISRQEAIDALYKMLHDCFWADDEELDAVITTLNELPSAQRNGKRMGTLFACSVCGNGSWLIDKAVPDYCPWCGARTEKGKNDV